MAAGSKFNIVFLKLHDESYSKPIHLLGANGIADYFRPWPKEVRSIDSKQLSKTVIGKWDLDIPVSLTQAQTYRTLVEGIKRHGRI